MTITIVFLLSALGGYLLGSIPFGLVLTRLAGCVDIRTIGSGSIGATNVLRTGRKDLALLTIFLDAFKAGIAAYLAFKLTAAAPYNFLGFDTTTNVMAELIAGTFGILGHNFPVWLKFKGGKGVASTFGFLLITNWQVALLALATWLVIAFATRYSSLSAITAAIMVPVFAFFLATPVYSIFYTFLAVLLIIRHHSNIARLIKGQESKISFKKKEETK